MAWYGLDVSELKLFSEIRGASVGELILFAGLFSDMKTNSSRRAMLVVPELRVGYFMESV